MFKNLVIYRIANGWQPDLTLLEEALQRNPFTECSPTQEQSGGWVPPRGQEHGVLAESVGGQWLLRFMQESRLLPGSVLARHVQEKIQHIEQQTGRKPGKKERRDLKDEARLDLLPQAFTKRGATTIWIDPIGLWLCVDTSSQSRADAITSALIEQLPGLSLTLLDTPTSPQVAMTDWLLSGEAPAGFSIDQECELQSSNEQKAAVRYARHPLDIEEIPEHIRAGKLPTRLAMTWEGRVSFLLTEGLQLRRLAFIGSGQESAAQSADDFDGNVALATGEMRQMLPDLLGALGENEKVD